MLMKGHSRVRCHNLFLPPGLIDLTSVRVCFVTCLFVCVFVRSFCVACCLFRPSYTSGGGQDGACLLAVPGACKSLPGSAPNSFVDVQPGSSAALEAAVHKQPVSVAIQANQVAFQSYSGGVLTGKCGNNLDHGVLAVGYGTWTDDTTK